MRLATALCLILFALTPLAWLALRDAAGEPERAAAAGPRAGEVEQAAPDRREKDVEGGTRASELEREAAQRLAVATACAPAQDVTGSGPLTSDFVVAAGRIEGRVLDFEGLPAPLFTLILYNSEDGIRGVREADVHGENGVFALEDVAVGEYELVVRRFRHAAPFISLSVVAPTELEVADDLVIRIYPPASLRGVVLTPEGLPALDARVYSDKGSDRVDADGRFHFGGASPGVRTLVAVAPSWAQSTPLEIKLRPGEQREDLVLVLGDVARIHGILRTQSGSPLAGADVSFEVVEDDARVALELWEYEEVRHPNDVLSGSTTTADDGSFGVPAVLAGKVRFYSEGYRPSKTAGVGLVGYSLEETVGTFAGRETFVELIAADPDCRLHVQLLSAHGFPKRMWCEVHPFLAGDVGPPSASSDFDAKGLAQLDVAASELYAIRLGIQERTSAGEAERPRFLAHLSAVRAPRGGNGDGDVQVIELELPTGSISGFARNAKGEPMTSGLLYVRSLGASPSEGQTALSSEGMLYLGADGSFALAHLVAGSYALSSPRADVDETLRFELDTGQALTDLIYASAEE